MDSTLTSGLAVAFIAAAAAWLLSVAAAATLGARVRATGSEDQVVGWAATQARLTRFVALPASIVALIAGGAWVLETNRTIEQDWWIGTALGAWLVAFVGSTMLRAPMLTRAVRLASEHGASDEDVRWRIRQVTLVVRGELLLLSVAAAVLVIKPT